MSVYSPPSVFLLEILPFIPVSWCWTPDLSSLFCSWVVCHIICCLCVVFFYFTSLSIHAFLCNVFHSFFASCVCVYSDLCQQPNVSVSSLSLSLSLSLFFSSSFCSSFLYQNSRSYFSFCNFFSLCCFLSLSSSVSFFVYLLLILSYHIPPFIDLFTFPLSISIYLISELFILFLFYLSSL